MKNMLQNRVWRLIRMTVLMVCLGAAFQDAANAQLSAAERNALNAHYDKLIREQEQSGMYEFANELRRQKQQYLGASVTNGTGRLPTYHAMPQSSLNSYTSPQNLAAYGQAAMIVGNALSQSFSRRKAREELQHQYFAPDQYPGMQTTAQRALEKLQRQYQEINGKEAEVRQQQEQVKRDLATLEKLQDEILKNISASKLDPKLFNLQDFPELADLRKEIQFLENELARMDQVLDKLPRDPQNIMKSWEGGVWNEETLSWDTHESDELLVWGKDGVGRWAEKDQVVWLSGQSGSEALASLSGGKSNDPMQKYIIKSDDPKFADGFDWHAYAKDNDPSLIEKARRAELSKKRDQSTIKLEPPKDRLDAVIEKKKAQVWIDHGDKDGYVNVREVWRDGKRGAYYRLPYESAAREYEIPPLINLTIFNNGLNRFENDLDTSGRNENRDQRIANTTYFLPTFRGGKLVPGQDPGYTMPGETIHRTLNLDNPKEEENSLHLYLLKNKVPSQVEDK